MDNQKNKRFSIKDIIIGILVLGWFFASFVAFCIFGETNQYYQVMVIGQLFLLPAVFGDFKENKIIKLLLFLIGLTCIIIPYLIMNEEVLNITINWDWLFAFGIIMVFLIAGLCMILIPIIQKRKLMERCSVTVYATVIRNEKTISDNGRTLYSPVYSFEFNKQKYEVNKNIYTNIEVKQIGTVEEIQINPDNPNEFLGNNSIYKFIIAFGVGITIFILPLLFMLMTGRLDI